MNLITINFLKCDNVKINAAIVEEGKANAPDVEFEIYYTKKVSNENKKLTKGEPGGQAIYGNYFE